MGKIYDVSMSIEPQMPVYKNKAEKRPVFEAISTHEEKGVQETRLCLDLHTGTHIDAPWHMLADGETVDSYALEDLMGPCKVVDLTGVRGVITPQDLAGQAEHGGFLLIKTKNSFSEEFQPDFVYLGADAARYLAEIGVRGVGTDALGIERAQPGHETHKILFQHRIVVIEGLRLAEVPAGSYRLVVAPLKIKGVEAAPARVFLIE
ncbi:MAG: cyclase family protein [Firmicutes bacterium]|nr:cyclase family protein [Bacillota bacterium]